MRVSVQHVIAVIVAVVLVAVWVHDPLLDWFDNWFGTGTRRHGRIR